MPLRPATKGRDGGGQQVRERSGCYLGVARMGQSQCPAIQRNIQERTNAVIRTVKWCIKSHEHRPKHADAIYHEQDRTKSWCFRIHVHSVTCTDKESGVSVSVPSCVLDKHKPCGVSVGRQGERGPRGSRKAEERTDSKA